MREYRHGPRADAGGVTFRLWAPAAKTVAVVTEMQVMPMQPRNDGWHETWIAQARAGEHYKFRIDDEIDVPDPASHFQPDDVNGPSEVINHAGYRWQTKDWRGRPWHETVLLELHVGAYTPSGDYRGVIEKLDHIAGAGFTAIELMPLSDFPGRWNWGYDGVLPFAPDAAYGAPDDLKALIDAAHARGLMVFLDVVYNHFGPEGNYLHRYAPAFFTDAAHTPWGAAIDYTVPQVRAFAIENALHWLDHYRFDGLRLDAVHAIAARGEPSILQEMSKAVGDLAAETGRHIHLVLENDDNEARLLDPPAPRPAGKYHAQWNDDYHHAWHALLTGEDAGYYTDYRERALLPRVMTQGFAYQGEPSSHRGGKPRGEPCGTLPATAFVTFLQNHDQIGNRARGERLDALASRPAVDAALQVTLLAPMPPMMFMGEEWAAREPFPFFCDFKGELADAVREGRRKEFKDAYARHGGDIPDPLDEATFLSAALDWSRQDDWRLDLVKRLLRLRHQEVVPKLAKLGPRADNASFDDGVLTADFHLDGATLVLAANLSDDEKLRPASFASRRMIWNDAPESLPAWSVHWGWR